MADKTGIEWTDSTWNPIVGCSVVSPGCTNCYAMKMAARIEAAGTAPRYNGLTDETNAGPVWNGMVSLAPDKTLLQPLLYRKPRKIFVNSMGDLFHEAIPDAWIDRVFAVMALSPQHTFQVLTKRADRMRQYLSARNGMGNPALCDAINAIPAQLGNRRGALEMPLPNVWVGVSAEDQRRADERIPLLLQTPASARFISAEPLLGPIDLDCPAIDWMQYPEGNGIIGDCLKIDWVIVGGESGSNARPMSIQWAREIRDQCARANIPFFFKQWGCWAPAGFHRSEEPGRFAFGDYEHDRSAMIEVDHYPRQFTKFGARSVMQWVGTKTAGRRLDGREHNEFPANRGGV